MERLCGRSFTFFFTAAIALSVFIGFGATPTWAQKDMGTIVGA